MTTAAADDAWVALLTRAHSLLDRAQDSIGHSIEWSLGGGTVLMLRMNHRHSKDIDIFLTDPATVGLFNPRLSDAALDTTSSYDESPGHIKLFLPEGEIDFVVATPLTTAPFENGVLLERELLLETSAEIVAKKMWHRGDMATARDLFDLAAVDANDGQAIIDATPFLRRHAHAFLQQISSRESVMRAEFEAIDRRDCDMTFDQCRVVAERILQPLLP